jgi:nucleotide-binding universal stress UspA family protein
MANLPSLHQYQETAERTTLEYLNRKKDSLMREDHDVSVATATGSAADQIIDYSRSKDIDLIALPSHGRSGIGRWVFGSVTDKVLHAGDTPVMVVRSKPL